MQGRRTPMLSDFSHGVRRFLLVGPVLALLAMGTASIATAQDTDNDGLLDAADPCAADARNRCAGSVAIDATTGSPIRLNANVSVAECSGAKVDCSGIQWAADFGFNTAKNAAVCDLGGGGEACVITGIVDLFGCEDEETEDLFQCEHWDQPTAPELVYSFDVSDGRYIVNLFFANAYGGTAAIGDRVFDIWAEGSLVYDDFDQVAAAGGSGKAVVRAVDVTVSDGNGLQIELTHVKENPTIKAIEVIESGCIIDPATGACAAQPIEFGKSTLQGTAGLDHPTSIAFGPDGRLYVSQQNGTIRAYSLARSGPNDYSVTAVETIGLVKSIPNHNDDGTLAPTQASRQVTGIVAAGTAAQPVLYVGSSDPRIGGGANANDKNVDTNSGVISRLTWTGSAWQKLDLVRGLPRSAENHATNGIVLDEAANVLYVAQGGNTNMGAPSNNFVFLPEYALSAAILAIDLGAIGNSTYDLPTLDDEDRAGSNDAGDPFGGNDGKNQAKIVPGGPVQVHAPGFRNPYDVVITRAGRMYTIDNGPNTNWGAVPVGEGTATCTNAVSEPGVAHKDGLHFISGVGYYGGHPNPTRAWTGNKFNASNWQSPVAASNPAECDYRTPGAGDGAIAIFNKSTNGLAEYTTAHFGGQLAGDLLAASFDKQIWRIELSADGTHTSRVTPLFSNVGASPLDVIVARADDPFPGTIWVADHGGNGIIVFEPAATPECNSATECDDANPCTTDACVAGTCQQSSNTAGCDDGIACTVFDVCSEGVCAGADACTTGQSCNLVNGRCEGVVDPLVDMTIEDFHLPGTQIGDVSPDVIETSDGCTGCHGPYDVENDPYSLWRGSLMGLAGRDPLFYAQMTTANQDVANVGYFCMRCHVPMSFITGHAYDTDGSTLDETDMDGITCHFCHSMVDPIYKPGISPIEDLTALAAHEEVPSFYGNSMFVLDPSGLRRGPYGDVNAQHAWVESAFHRSSDMCGTCHDVGNVAVTKQPDGTYRYNAIDQPSPTEDPHEMFPLERTYTEWKLSAFANGGVDMGGRFGGTGPTVIETCQDCHMPKAVAPGCVFSDPRPDLPRHEFAGAAAPVLDLVAEYYKDDPAVDLPSIARSREAAVAMLARAASLDLAQNGQHLEVRVINETGHKIPTGHIEGRRVWINVQFRDDGGTLVAEHGHYDEAEAELDEASTVIFEMHVGLSVDAAAATGYPDGPTGHMALADTIEKDNRIPPRGFDNLAYENAGAPAVGEVYADGQYWHDSNFEIPDGAVSAEVTLYYQNTPRHYIEMLRDNNVSDHWGDTLHDLWETTGKGAPIPMQSVTFDLAKPCATAVDCDDGDACNGVETCDLVAGCRAGIPIDCDDGDACTTDSCSGGICAHAASCPPAGEVAVDEYSVRGICSGDAGDTLTIADVPVGSQPDRILVVGVGAEEDNGDCNLALASVTYGGVAMSRAVTALSGTSSWRACNGIFYMLNPPAGTANVVVAFPTTTGTPIDNRHAGALVIYNAAQQGPEAVASGGAGTAVDPVSTAIAVPSAGGVIVDVVSQGNAGSFVTGQPGQAERWDESCGTSSSAGSIKPVTSVGQITLGWSHSSPKRYAHALAAFAPSGSLGVSTTSTTSTTTTTVTVTTTTTTIPPATGNVGVDGTSVRSACEGTAGDMITIPDVPVGTQAHRVLVATVGAEEPDADCDLSLAMATYGGLPMILAESEISGFNNWRACGGIFYLPDPPVGTANVVITFPTAVGDSIDNRQAGAFVLFNAAQTGPIATNKVGGGKINPVTTSIASIAGGVVVDILARGNIGTFTPLASGQVLRWEESCTSSSSATSTKVTASAGDTTLGWLHSTSPNRYAHALAAFAPAGGGGGPTTTIPIGTTTTVPDATTTSTLPIGSEVCFVPATDTTLVLSGTMTSSAAFADGDDTDPSRDSLSSTLLFANTTSNAFTGGSADHATYVVTLSATAPWYLWGRFYYPGAIGSNDANSFFVSVDSGSTAKFGNKKDRFRQWHWDGNGNIEQGANIGLPLGTLGAGGHAIKIEKREVTPTPPRLDVVCFTQDGTNPPNDAIVAALLGLP